MCSSDAVYSFSLFLLSFLFFTSPPLAGPCAPSFRAASLTFSSLLVSKLPLHIFFRHLPHYFTVFADENWPPSSSTGGSPRANRTSRWNIGKTHPRQTECISIIRNSSTDDIIFEWIYVYCVRKKGVRSVTNQGDVSHFPKWHVFEKLLSHEINTFFLVKHREALFYFSIRSNRYPTVEKCLEACARCRYHFEKVLQALIRGPGWAQNNKFCV